MRPGPRHGQARSLGSGVGVSQSGPRLASSEPDPWVASSAVARPTGSPRVVSTTVTAWATKPGAVSAPSARPDGGGGVEVESSGDVARGAVDDPSAAPPAMPDGARATSWTSSPGVCDVPSVGGDAASESPPAAPPSLVVTGAPPSPPLSPPPSSPSFPPRITAGGLNGASWGTAKGSSNCAWKSESGMLATEIRIAVLDWTRGLEPLLKLTSRRLPPVVGWVPLSLIPTVEVAPLA